MAQTQADDSLKTPGPQHYRVPCTHKGDSMNIQKPFVSKTFPENFSRKMRISKPMVGAEAALSLSGIALPEIHHTHARVCARTHAHQVLRHRQRLPHSKGRFRLSGLNTSPSVPGGIRLHYHDEPGVGGRNLPCLCHFLCFSPFLRHCPYDHPCYCANFNSRRLYR